MEPQRREDREVVRRLRADDVGRRRTLAARPERDGEAHRRVRVQGEEQAGRGQVEGGARGGSRPRLQEATGGDGGGGGGGQGHDVV